MYCISYGHVKDSTFMQHAPWVLTFSAEKVTMLYCGLLTTPAQWNSFICLVNWSFSESFTNLLARLCIGMTTNIKVYVKMRKSRYSFFKQCFSQCMEQIPWKPKMTIQTLVSQDGNNFSRCQKPNIKLFIHTTDLWKSFAFTANKNVSLVPTTILDNKDPWQ